MARRRRFIPGIYNYCDRWCERCGHTARCRVFRDTERVRERHERRGADAGEMDTALGDVSRSFEKARRMLRRWAKANDLDLDRLAADGAADLADRRLDRKTDGHPLTAGTHELMDRCRGLLEKLRAVFDEARDDAVGRAEMMDVAGEIDGLRRVGDAAEVISWYHTMTHVKTRRALDGWFEAGMQQERDDGAGDFALSDAAGSASVARKGLVRMKTALTVVYDWDEALRDEVLDLLVLAERLQKELESLLPGCLDFPWPPAEE
ncbi:MAG TPA: hypothetical protein VM695_15535 [Phycisphaerae bacterium]|nr:hypothetical protein [Phycisphaerae bacterium]